MPITGGGLFIGCSGQVDSVGKPARIVADDQVLQVICSSRLAKLLTQAVQGPLLAADTEKRTLIIGTLIQHLTAREYFPTQLLGRPGQKKLGLDEIPLEKRNDRLVQFRDVVRAARAHHDAIGIRGA